MKLSDIRFSKYFHLVFECLDRNSILNIQHKIKLTLSRKYRDFYYLEICDYDPSPCCKWSNSWSEEDLIFEIPL